MTTTNQVPPTVSVSAPPVVVPDQLVIAAPSDEFTVNDALPVVFTSGKKKKRYYKDLLAELQDVGPEDIEYFVCATEVYRDKRSGDEVEVYRAQSIQRGDYNVELEHLNVNQLRLLCRRLGIQGINSSTRVNCRKLIGLMKNINRQAATRGYNPRSTEQAAFNMHFRMVTVIFSSEVLERFKQLNDAKDRVDLETGKIQNKFWIDVCMAYNDLGYDNNPIATETVDNRRTEFWEDIKKAGEFVDVSTSDKTKETTEKLVDLLDTTVNLSTSNV